MADESTQVSPAEFSKIPLDFIIATPLLTTINAHRVASETTLKFVQDLLVSGTDDKGKPTKTMPSVSFEVKISEDANGKPITKTVTVPLITLVKVPSLNFDSRSVSFNYNISQVITEKNSTVTGAKLGIETKGLLSKFIGASLTGSVDHSKSLESTANRGGSLDIKIHVSESAMPAGLQKIINGLVDSVLIPLSEEAKTDAAAKKD
jgi:hypothetical protein